MFMTCSINANNINQTKLLVVVKHINKQKGKKYFISKKLPLFNYFDYSPTPHLDKKYCSKVQQKTFAFLAHTRSLLKQIVQDVLISDRAITQLQ